MVHEAECGSWTNFFIPVDTWSAALHTVAYAAVADPLRIDRSGRPLDRFRGAGLPVAGAYSPGCRAGRQVADMAVHRVDPGPLAADSQAACMVAEGLYSPASCPSALA